MSADSELELLDTAVTRFRDDYFIRDLAQKVLFFIPNFVGTARARNLQIQLLRHLSAADEAQIVKRLAGLPFELSPGRSTLEEIEQRARHRFPEVGNDEAR